MSVTCWTPDVLMRVMHYDPKRVYTNDDGMKREVRSAVGTQVRVTCFRPGS